MQAASGRGVEEPPRGGCCGFSGPQAWDAWAPFQNRWVAGWAALRDIQVALFLHQKEGCVRFLGPR